jgi:hypothetical protein
MLYNDIINKLRLKTEESYENWIVKLTRESFDYFLDNAYRLQFWIDMGDKHPEDIDYLDKVIDEAILRKGG